MNYKLYTCVDITHTRQYRNEHGKEIARWEEQNFNTIVQTLGMRANIYYYNSPTLIEVKGSLIGFDTDEIIRVWRFDFYTEQNHEYQKDQGPIGLLLDDFHLVPFISGLDELLIQNYDVFITIGDHKNITFFQQ